jgi:hypothetical protein
LHSFTIKVFKLCVLPSRVFLKRFCDVSKIGDNPENNLVKFGYTPDMRAFSEKTGCFYIIGYLGELIIKI